MSKTPKNQSMLTRIYTLSVNNNIRYIGKTVQKLEQRLKEHIRVAKSGKVKNHRTNWINSVLRSGLTVVIKEIDHCSWNKSSELEQHYIKYYKELGCDLVNETFGGEGNLGYKKSVKTISKLKNSLRNRLGIIYQYDINGNFIKSWNNPVEAAESLGLKVAAGITRCLRGKRQSYKGFRWMKKYEDDPKTVLKSTNFQKQKKITLNKNAKKVIQLDLNGKELNMFDSPWKACQALGKNVTSSSGITRVCLGKKQTAFGFKWKYA